MKNNFASVIIPVYNQLESLKKVLNGFANQDIPMDKFEVVVVDDGSSDGLENIDYVKCFTEVNLSIKLIHQKRSGRASARNVGGREAEGDILIFCDADRVPDRSFVRQHMIMHSENNLIVIGSAYDYFGVSKNISEGNICWEQVKRLSKLSSYYKKVSRMYNIQGEAQSTFVWLSFLVGNSSMSRGVFDYFDERFVEWGLEHFEFAYRKYNEKCSFYYTREAVNYHIPHARKKNFYETQLRKSASLMSEIHPEINEDVLVEFILSDMEVKELDDKLIRNI